MLFLRSHLYAHEPMTLFLAKNQKTTMSWTRYLEMLVKTQKRMSQLPRATRSIRQHIQRNLLNGQPNPLRDPWANPLHIPRSLAVNQRWSLKLVQRRILRNHLRDRQRSRNWDQLLTHRNLQWGQLWVHKQVYLHIRQSLQQDRRLFQLFFQSIKQPGIH